MSTDETKPSPVTRRQVLGTLGILSAVPLVSCSGYSSTSVTSSTDASLSTLVLSSGTLSPAFAAGTTAYTASVSNATGSVTVTATKTDSGSTININGTNVASGAASGAVTLAVGTNTITIVVTAASGSTRIYSIVVTRAGTGTTACVLIPQETDGPYPLYSVLGNSALMRADIRDGRTGVPVSLVLSLVNVNNNCSPLTNAAVYVWHCDKDGNYSGYGNQAGLSYLRGIQLTNSNGQVTFGTIYPGWYAGRITHIHFQVYLNANVSGTATATSQIAFPQAVTTAVYNSSLYAARGQNSSVASFSADNVFADGTTYQLATVTGDVTAGYVATLNVGVAA
jgi:protocatechuate 3,4-dioxygenase beta subunit